jgi:hypothetical protein
MKQKDIVLIVVIAFMSAVISLLLSNVVFAPPNNRQQPVEEVQPITADFPQPDSRFFNKQAIDPTRIITIDQNSNTDPFSGAKP